MAVQETLTKLVCRAGINNGQTSTGAIRLAYINLPAVSKSGYNATDFNSIVDLLQPVISLTIIKAEAVKTYEVYAED